MAVLTPSMDRNTSETRYSERILFALLVAGLFVLPASACEQSDPPGSSGSAHTESTRISRWCRFPGDRSDFRNTSLQIIPAYADSIASAAIEPKKAIGTAGIEIGRKSSAIRLLSICDYVTRGAWRVSGRLCSTGLYSSLPPDLAPALLGQALRFYPAAGLARRAIASARIPSRSQPLSNRGRNRNMAKDRCGASG